MKLLNKIKASIQATKQAYQLLAATVNFNQAKYVSKAKNNSFTNNRFGMAGMAVVGTIIGLALGAYVVAYTLPSAIVAVTNETLWTGAPDSVKTLGTLVLGIVIIVAAILAFIKMAISGGD